MTATAFSGTTALVRGLAFLIHILTASGAALALLALVAATRSDWPLMFLFLGVALVVDAIDGPLARAASLKERLPRWSGDVLDLVVDYTTYVFVPAYVLVSAQLMPEAMAVWAGAIAAVSGTLYFADRNMKTSDHFFRGFPAVWNLIVFYLLLLQPPATVCFVIVVLFAGLTFVPIRFVHPFRVRRWRVVTVALLTLWAVLAGAAVRQGLSPEGWITAALCLIGVYFLVFGLLPVRQDTR